jgi:uncharacterized protein (DUF58 family)
LPFRFKLYRTRRDYFLDNSTNLKEFIKNNYPAIRNAVFGVVVMVGGLGLAFVTLWAQWQNNPRLAGAAAIASLVFVVLILLFVVPPLARSASREVAHFDLPFEITGGGLIFLGVTAIVGFAAWNTGNNLLFIVLSFLLAALAVSVFLGNANLKKLEARVRFPDAIFAGEKCAFTVSLKNRKWLFPTFSAAVTLRGVETDDPFGGRKFARVKPPVALAAFFRRPFLKKAVGYFVHVPLRGEAVQQTEQIFTKRGQFIIRDFELATKFPLGFWHQRRRLSAVETTIYVFPALKDVRRELRLASRQVGQFASNRRGSGQDLLGLRDYDQSDDVRRVDWRATARTGQIIVREFASDDERLVSIILDSDTKDAERFERGISLVASLVAHLISEKSEVRLVTDDFASNFGTGRAHLNELLRRLAVVAPQTEKPSETKILEFPVSEGELQIFVAPVAEEFSREAGRIVLPY